MARVEQSQARRCIRFQGPSATKSVQAQDWHSQTGVHEHLFGCFVVRHALNDVQNSIMKRLCTTFDMPCIQQVLIPLITQQSKVSLRLLDFFVTNYCRESGISIKSLSGGEIVVYHDYKRSLSYYRRRNFDPFRRSRRRVNNKVVRYNVTFQNNGIEYETTVGQLCFVFWAHTRGVLRYVEKHSSKLEQCMNRRVARPAINRNAVQVVTRMAEPSPWLFQNFQSAKQ